MVPGVKNVIKPELDQWNEDGTSTTKPNRDDYGNLAGTLRKWKQTMQLYLNVVMSGKTEEEQQYSTFLFVSDERGRQIFNTFTCNKKITDGVEIEEDDIMVKGLFQKFKDYCLLKKNLIVARRRFFTRNQQHDETIDAYFAQLKNLSLTCEFGDLKEGLTLYKLVNGIQSNKIRDTLLRKGADLTLQKKIDVCRAEETTNHEMKIIKQEIDVDAIQRNRRRSNNNNRGKMQHTAQAATSTTSNNQKKCKYYGEKHFPKQCPAFGQTCRKCGRKNHWANCCNARITGENQTTKDYVIEAVTKKVGKKTIKAEVQNEVKKIRNKEEQANGKMKKKKQQLDDYSSMENNKEKLYDDRTAINKTNKLIVSEEVMMHKIRK